MRNKSNLKEAFVARRQDPPLDKNIAAVRKIFFGLATENPLQIIRNTYIRCAAIQGVGHDQSTGKD